jgi:hypothetical protein
MLLSPSHFGPEYMNKIQKIIGNKNINNVLVGENSLAILKDNDNLYPLGCNLCIEGKIENNKYGYPSIQGKALINATDAFPEHNDIGNEIISNLWICPNCNLPILSLIPKII